MSFKIMAKTLFAWTIIETVILLSGWTLVGRTQNLNDLTVSSKSDRTATTLMMRGKAQLQQENYREAISLFTEAIQLNPNDADFYYERGSLLGQLGDKEAAIRDFDSAILRNPNHSWAYLRRAGMSFYLGFDRRVTDDRGVRLRTLDYGSRNASAMLDLQTAKNLFAQQNDIEGHQIAESLIEHFNQKLR